MRGATGGGAGEVRGVDSGPEETKYAARRARAEVGAGTGGRGIDLRREKRGIFSTKRLQRKRVPIWKDTWRGC